MEISEGLNARLGTLPVPPGKSIRADFEKRGFYVKNAETTINISSGAFREKRQWLQNRVFCVLGPPWSPPRPEPFPSRPPRRAPEPALELPGPPRTLPRALRSHQGPHQIHKVGMLKTLEISLFGTQESQKNAPGRFFDAPSAPQGPSGTATLILQGAPGPPKCALGAPRPPPGAPQGPPGTP